MVKGAIFIAVCVLCVQSVHSFLKVSIVSQPFPKVSFHSSSRKTSLKFSCLSGLTARLVPPPPPPRFNGPPPPPPRFNSLSAPESPFEPKGAVASKRPESGFSRLREEPKLKANNFVSIDDVPVTPGANDVKGLNKQRSSFNRKDDGRSYRKSFRPTVKKPTAPPPMLSRSDWLKAATIGGACA